MKRWWHETSWCFPRRFVLYYYWLILSCTTIVFVLIKTNSFAVIMWDGSTSSSRKRVNLSGRKRGNAGVNKADFLKKQVQTGPMAAFHLNQRVVCYRAWIHPQTCLQTQQHPCIHHINTCFQRLLTLQTALAGMYCYNVERRPSNSSPEKTTTTWSICDPEPMAIILGCEWGKNGCREASR